MSTSAPQKKIVKAVLDEFGTTYSDELKIHVEKNTPSSLFQLLCFSLLSSARISHDAAKSAAKALKDHGWTTVAKMADSTWRERTAVLNQSGYARYDESTSSMLGDTAEMLMDKYKGDLRRLRDEADRDPEQERARLKECKGVGEVGASIFFREVQTAWDEISPFMDKRAAKGAKKLGLPSDPKELQKLCPRKKDFPRLVAGLVRLQFRKDDLERIKNEAA